MISSLSVGAEFRVVDLASESLAGIAAKLREIAGLADDAKMSLKTLGETAFAPLTAKIADIDKQLGGLGDAGAAAADRMSNAFGAAATKMSEQIKALETQIREMKVAPGVGGGGGGRAGMFNRGGGSAGGAAAAESSGSGGFGLAAEAAGWGSLAAIWESAKASLDLNKVQENVKISGVSDAEITKATQYAKEIGSKYGITPAQVLQGFNEIRNPLNKGVTADEGMEAAMRHGDTLARAAIVLRNQGKDSNGDIGRELYDLVKSAEFRNAIGDEQFDKAVSSMVAADVATGGIVRPREWLQTSQMLKSALPGMSNEYLYTIMPELMQEFGGSRAGTAGMSLYQQLIGGHMTTKGVNLLYDLGLVNSDKVEYDKIGRIKSANPGFYKDADEFRADPLKGMADLIEAMKKHGIVGQNEETDYLASMFGNRNAAQMAQSLAFQYQRLERGATGIKNTWDLGPGSEELIKNNEMEAFRRTWADLNVTLLDIGKFALPPVLFGLQTLDDAFKQISLFLHGDFRDPKTGKSPSVHADWSNYWQHIKGAIFGGGDSGGHSSVYGPGNGVGSGSGSGASTTDLDDIWRDYQSRYGGLSGSDLGLVPGGASPLLPIPSWFRKSGYTDGVYRGDDSLGGGIASAQTVDILASVVNLANVGGGYPGNGGIMPAAYDPDADAGGAGDYVGGGGLHSGGGYTVLGGGHGSSILRARGHYSDGASLAYSGGSAGMDQRGMQLMTYLVGQGWTPEAAAIAVGNAQQESSIRSDGQAGDGGISHGMFQWNHERYAGLLAYARAHGLDPSSLAAQEGFFAAEAEAKIPGWKHQKDLSAAGLISHAYEGYGDNSTGTRIANSKHFLALWKDHAATTPTVAADYPDHGFHSSTVHTASLNAVSAGGAGTPVEIHVHSHLDGKRVAHSVQKHVVKSNSQIYGPSMHDKLGSLSTPDAGYQTER